MIHSHQKLYRGTKSKWKLSNYKWYKKYTETLRWGAGLLTAEWGPQSWTILDTTNSVWGILTWGCFHSHYSSVALKGAAIKGCWPHSELQGKAPRLQLCQKQWGSLANKYHSCLSLQYWSGQTGLQPMCKREIWGMRKPEGVKALTDSWCAGRLGACENCG